MFINQLKMFKTLNFCAKRYFSVNHSVLLSKAVRKTAVPFKIIKHNIEDNVDFEKVKFIPLFHMPAIQPVSILCKMKYYEGGLVVLSYPLAYYLEHLQIIPELTANSFFIAGLTVFCYLMLGSVLFKDTIGMIYASEDHKYLKIVSMDFNGKRIDSYIKSKDWMTFSELPELKFISKFFSLPRTLDFKLRWKIYLPMGKTYNKETFEELLGKLN